MNMLRKLNSIEKQIEKLRAKQSEALIAYRLLLNDHLLHIDKEIDALRAGRKPDAPQFDFTNSEKKVVRCLIQGITTGEGIARELGIGERTVRTHIYNIMEKVGIRSRAELAVRFKEWWS